MRLILLLVLFFNLNVSAQNFIKDSLVFVGKDTLHYQIFKYNRDRVYVITNKKLNFEFRKDYYMSRLNGGANIHLQFSESNGKSTYPALELKCENLKKYKIKLGALRYNYDIEKNQYGDFIVIERLLTLVDDDKNKPVYTMGFFQEGHNTEFSLNINFALPKIEDYNEAEKDILPSFKDYFLNRIFIAPNYYP